MKKMSLQPKEILHIICEVIILISMSVYFSHKNNHLQKQLLILQDRVDQQHAMIEKHENTIAELVHTVNNLVLNRQRFVAQPDKKLQTKQSTVKQPIKRVEKPVIKTTPSPVVIAEEKSVTAPADALPQMFVQMMSSFPFQNTTTPVSEELSRVVEIVEDEEEPSEEIIRRYPISPAQSEDLYAELTEELEDLRDEAEIDEKSI